VRWILLFSLLAGCSQHPEAKPEGAVIGQVAKLEWGLYQISWGRRFEGMLDRELSKFATFPHYVMFYRDLGRPYPRHQVDVIRSRSATPIVSLELWKWMRARKGEYLTGINAGEYDAFFRGWAKEAKAEGGRVLLRFGFEMNGEWFSWSRRPKEFVKAWRRAHRIMTDEVGAKNIEWVWAPNIVSIPRTAENDMHLYYPGDDVVDWVALDGYNFGDNHDQWHKWESFETIFESALSDFAERYPNKPIMIAETGAARGKGEQRARWINDAHAYLATRPQVKALVWFHYDKRRESEPDWRIDTTPQSLHAFNQTFAAER